MVFYKVVLEELHKSTGGRSRLNTEFEAWSDSKLNKYNVDLDLYNHIDVASRHDVLVNRYCKQRTSYLIVIHI